MKSLSSTIMRHGCVVSLFADEAGDGVECVEEEVRLDLSAKGVELGLRELLVEACGLGLLKGQALSGVEHVTDQENCGVEDEGREECRCRTIATKVAEMARGREVWPRGSVIFPVQRSRRRR